MTLPSVAFSNAPAATACMYCQNWRPQYNLPMARQHYARCNLGPSWTFLAFNHSCPQHQPAAAEIVSARVRWLAAPQKRKK